MSEFESHSSSFVSSVFTVTSRGSGRVLELKDDRPLNIILAVPLLGYNKRR